MQYYYNLTGKTVLREGLNEQHFCFITNKTKETSYCSLFPPSEKLKEKH